MSASISNNKSTLKKFLGSISTIQGDLSNITAPPFLLATHSTTELPQYWADRPNLFVAPALEASADKRALLVLKYFLASLKNQQYAGCKEGDGVKKPLNAFLGELFVGCWLDKEHGETRLVAEQVSHHPPATACYLWNETCGVSSEGFTCQEITFSGSVSIKQKGYAILHLDRYDEDYLIPLPDVRVKGVVGGTPYPELVGRYQIICSSGWVSEVRFSGKGLLAGGEKNTVEARVFEVERPGVDVFTARGHWNGELTFVHARSGAEIETFDVDAEKASPVTIPDISEQDPWESRKAWRGVIDALERGDMEASSKEKAVVEEGQRELRKQEEARQQEWTPLFFRREDTDPVYEKLSKSSDCNITVDPANGFWRVKKEVAKTKERPFHSGLEPTGALKAQPETAPRGDKNDDSSSQIRNEPREEADGQANSNEDQDKEAIERLRVEELLRAKYSSKKF